MKTSLFRLTAGQASRTSAAFLIGAFLVSCAGLSVPEQEDESSRSDEDVTEDPDPEGSGGTLVTGNSGGSSSGGSSSGGSSSGGSSAGGSSSGGSTAGTGGVPSGSECAAVDSDCDDLVGCHTCELENSVYACIESTTLSECGGACVDTDTSNAHCGACDDPCDKTGAACSGGSCECTNASEEICGDACVNTNTNAAHCGACDDPCGSGTPHCVGGQCYECAVTTQLDCGTGCIDVQTDEAHCGDCVTTCNTASGEVCIAGECAAGACGGVQEWNTTWANNNGAGRAGGTLTVYQGKLYKNAYWTGQGDVPGVSATWVLQQSCT